MVRRRVWVRVPPPAPKISKNVKEGTTIKGTLFFFFNFKNQRIYVLFGIFIFFILRDKRNIIIFYLLIFISLIGVGLVSIVDVLLFLPSIMLGVIMGANDAGNILGPTVGNGIFKIKQAIYAASLMIILGAWIEGRPGLKVSSNLVKVNTIEIIIINLSVVVITLFFLKRKLPISLTQAIVGASVGVGILIKEINTKILLYIVLGWFSTPVVAFIISYALQKTLALVFRGMKNLRIRFYVLRILLWVFTLYGGFSLGANNAGKISGILYQRGYNIYFLLVLSGLSLSAGVLFFGKNSIYTIGRGIMALDDFTAMVSIATVSITIWIYSIIGLPISAAHAIIGSIIGAGYSKGTRIQNPKIFQRIIFSWLEAPMYSGIFSAFVYSIYKLLW